jgi:hypothetical protein
MSGARMRLTLLASRWSTAVRRGASTRWLVALFALQAVGLGCSVGQAVVGIQQGRLPTATWTQRPTFALAAAATTVPATAAGIRGDLPPGVTVLPAASAGNGSATADANGFDLVLLATPSPRPGTVAPPTPPTRSASPTTAGSRASAQPTPYAVVLPTQADTRRGPGTAYDLVAAVSGGQELMVLGRSTGSDWWRVCCVANQPVWISGQEVALNNPTNLVPALTPAPTPTPLPTATRTATPTAVPTRMPPFDVGIGPLFPIQRDNGILTIWVMVFQGPPDNQTALVGYTLNVRREGADVSDGQVSHGMPFDRTDSASEGYMPYNLKFEMRSAGEANWQIYLARPDGSAVSPVTRFTTLGDSYRNQVVYVGYWLAR